MGDDQPARKRPKLNHSNGRSTNNRGHDDFWGDDGFVSMANDGDSIWGNNNSEALGNNDKDHDDKEEDDVWGNDDIPEDELEECYVRATQALNECTQQDPASKTTVTNGAIQSQSANYDALAFSCSMSQRTTAPAGKISSVVAPSASQSSVSAATPNRSSAYPYNVFRRTPLPLCTYPRLPPPFPLAQRANASSSSGSTAPIASNHAGQEQPQPSKLAEQYAKEGEVALLRSELRKKELEKERERASSLKRMDDQAKKHRDMIKKMKEEMDAITSQLKFKDRQVEDLKENLQLKAKIAAAVPQSTTSNAVPVLRTPVRSGRGFGKDGFPDRLPFSSQQPRKSTSPQSKSPQGRSCKDADVQTDPPTQTQKETDVISHKLRLVSLGMESSGRPCMAAQAAGNAACACPGKLSSLEWKLSRSGGNLDARVVGNELQEWVGMSGGAGNKVTEEYVNYFTKAMCWLNAALDWSGGELKEDTVKAAISSIVKWMHMEQDWLGSPVLNSVLVCLRQMTIKRPHCVKQFHPVLELLSQSPGRLARASAQTVTTFLELATTLACAKLTWQRWPVKSFPLKFMEAIRDRVNSERGRGRDKVLEAAATWLLCSVEGDAEAGLVVAKMARCWSDVVCRAVAEEGGASSGMVARAGVATLYRWAIQGRFRIVDPDNDLLLATLPKLKVIGVSKLGFNSHLMNIVDEMMAPFEIPPNDSADEAMAVDGLIATQAI